MNRETLDAVFADLPDSVRVLDRDGGVIYSNEAALLVPHEDLSGRRPECGAEIVGTTPEELRRETVEKGVFKRQHLVHRPPGGGEVADYFEVTLCPLRDADGRVAGALEILRDETTNFGLQHYLIGRSERQETEIARRSQETARLQERETDLAGRLGDLERKETEYLYRDRVSSLGQLAGGLAHEIRTPLGAILSTADLARRTLARTGLPEDRAAPLDDALELIGDAARRIHGVLKALQSFSRLDEAPLKEIDIAEALDATVSLVQYRMGDRIRVARDYAPVRPVRCRPDALSQVFLNLVVNAVQAIPERGTIRLSAAERDGQAVIRVEDDGCGVPADVRARIFDLGFTTRAGAGGSGLGLALCKRIVEEHGGTIELLPREGGGTVAELRLPVAGNGAS